MATVLASNTWCDTREARPALVGRGHATLAPSSSFGPRLAGTFNNGGGVRSGDGETWTSLRHIIATPRGDTNRASRILWVAPPRQADLSEAARFHGGHLVSIWTVAQPTGVSGSWRMPILLLTLVAPSPPPRRQALRMRAKHPQRGRSPVITPGLRVVDLSDVSSAYAAPAAFTSRGCGPGPCAPGGQV